MGDLDFGSDDLSSYETISDTLPAHPLQLRAPLASYTDEGTLILETPPTSFRPSQVPTPGSSAADQTAARSAVRGEWHGGTSKALFVATIALALVAVGVFTGAVLRMMDARESAAVAARAAR